MNDDRPNDGPEEISRFRAVVVAGLRVKQLARGSKPRIELDHKRHKYTIIAMEEVRRGLITFTPFSVPPFHPASAMGDIKAGVERPAPVG